MILHKIFISVAILAMSSIAFLSVCGFFEWTRTAAVMAWLAAALCASTLILGLVLIWIPL